METIKNYYLANFPTDELGLEINEDATFEGLFETLDRYRDVYDYIGVMDSIVRERIFERLCEIMECEYDVVYDQWMLGYELSEKIN